MPRVDAFLQLGREQGCSDVHLAVGIPPMLRHNSELSPIKYRNLSNDELQSLIDEIIPKNAREVYQKHHYADFSYQSEQMGRYRVSLFNKHGGMGAAFRIIPPNIPTLADLGLPDFVEQKLYSNNGMILVTGSTGTGKSTTLASMINVLNKTRRLNIITLEDPIEFVHKSARSLVVQREIGTHVSGFQAGLRSALREDPDVILVGELRDPETIAMAMTAAETGHLVLGTLHTTSAAKTLDRIIDAMPTEQKAQAANFLAQQLLMVISQKLVKTADNKGRKAVLEIFVQHPAISNLIMNGKIFQVPSVMQTGKGAGMKLMDQALMDAVKAKEIDPDDAYLHATDKQAFQRYVTDMDLLPQVDLK